MRRTKYIFLYEFSDIFNCHPIRCKYTAGTWWRNSYYSIVTICSPYPTAVMRKCLLCLVVAVTGKVGIKGKVSRDFLLQVFIFPRAPDYLICGISHFVKNSWRYTSQLMVKCPNWKFSHILHMYYFGADYTNWLIFWLVLLFKVQ